MATGQNTDLLPPPAGDPWAAPLAIIRAHLSVAQPDVALARAACTALAEMLAVSPSAAPGVYAVLGELLRRQRNAASPVVFEFLLAESEHAADAAAIFTVLLSAARADLVTQALRALAERLRHGGVHADAALAGALELLAARGTNSLPGDLLQEASASVVQSLVAEFRVAGAVDLLQPERPAAVRALAARVLDVAGAPAAAACARAVLGEKAYAMLAPHLSYTRATHRELVALTPPGAVRCPCARSLESAQAQLGEGVLSRALAELRWQSVVWGLEVEPVVALAHGDSLPFFMHPAEAELLERCVAARRLWQGHVLTALGSAGESGEGAGDADAEAVRRFRRSNVLHAELLAEILEVAPVTYRKLGRILELLDQVTEDFAALFRGEDAEAASLPEVYRALRAPFARVLAQGEADELVPGELAREVQRFEDPPSLAAVRTLHGLKRFLHQRGLSNALQRFRGSAQAEHTVDLLLLRNDEPPRLVRRIRYAELEPQATSRRMPTAVHLLARGLQRHLLHGGTTFPSVLALCYGTEVQVYIQFRNHPAFLRLDLSPPRRGGMVDLEYYAVSQYELAQHPERDVPAIRTVLRRLGYHVELDGVRLHARYDKEAAMERGDILEHAAALCALLPHLMDLDWTVGSLQYSRTAREDVAAQWAEIFHLLGALPTERLLTTGRCQVIERYARDALGERAVPWDGRTPYSAARFATLPAGALAALHAELEQRGLAHLVSAVSGELGQRALERAILEPLRAARARGEVLENAGRLDAAPRACFEREPEADRLARLLLAGGAQRSAAAALAVRLRPLERQLRTRVTGTINGWNVERADVHLGSERVALAWLRDDEGVLQVASAARDGVWYRTRPSSGHRWQPGGALEPERVLRLLLADNYLSPDRELRSSGGLTDEPARLLERVRAARAAEASGLAGSERCIPGSAGSPGRVTGPVRIRTSGTPRGLEGGVLTAPDIGPADAPLLRSAVALLTTGGGILSHIGLLALELGRPSLVVRGDWRVSPAASPALALPRLEFQPSSLDLDGLHVVRRLALAERWELVHDGDLVVVDADAGHLQLLGGDRTALALHEGLRALQAVLDPAPPPAERDPLVRRGELIRIMHGLEKVIARLTRPDLAEHLVTELGIGPLAGNPHAIVQRQRLIACLGANSAVRDTVHSARARLLARLQHVSEERERELRQLLPVCGPLELLQLRLAARRDRDRVAEAARLSDGLVGARPGDAHLEQDCCARLATLRAEALERGRALPTAEEWRLRHLLAGARRLAPLLPPLPPAGAAVEAALTTRVAALDECARQSHDAALTITSALAGLELARLIGFKAANLGECARILGPAAVPPWFALTDRAFRMALATGTGRHGTLQDAIRSVLASAQARAAGEWEQLAAEIRGWWCDVVLPPELVDRVLTDYLALAAGGPLPLVAVRSSTWEEDTPDAAWAGQFDTYLCVQGEEELLRHVRLAWAGLWSARALQHRAHAVGAAGLGVGGGVIVQRMVDARVAGVVQTVHAATGRMRELVINAALGLGEGVVSGAVEVDEIRVRKPGVTGGPLQLQYRVGDKRDCIRFDATKGSGTRRAETRFHERLRPALEYAEAEDLVTAALALECTYGQPLEIEFAFEGASPMILQARPIPLFQATLRDTLTCAPLDSATRELTP